MRERMQAKHDDLVATYKRELEERRAKFRRGKRKSKIKFWSIVIGFMGAGIIAMTYTLHQLSPYISELYQSVIYYLNK